MLQRKWTLKLSLYAVMQLELEEPKIIKTIKDRNEETFFEKRTKQLYHAVYDCDISWVRW
jgi:hypothetical protein